MIKDYFDEISHGLARESERMRKDFATHRQSAGTNREAIVCKLLRQHILQSVGIETGLVLSASGDLSAQSDIILVDKNSNAALHGDRPIPIWLVESVYGVIEVKTQFTPSTLTDSVAKCKKFKALPRNFADSCGRQAIKDNLFCVWSFESPADLNVAKENIAKEVDGLSINERPDFIVVPGSFLWRGGRYFDLTRNGQPGSSHYNQRLREVGGDVEKLLDPSEEMMGLGENSLFTFLYWINSWLYAAGPRRPDLVKYYPSMTFGSII
ncbi:MAG: hypothetical protein Q8O26_09090 [Phreatobacter sp.]|uniref:DUF6602 domain-containing protein n=1 Tax=Phreatobacter sp. TaxID=1966341 RepID=UPI002732C5A2|nr:DUF6602 domain-containing protein [Phreatobacter sp.]MDP2802024.1 hypothetical protein [Phreatobacter sp.]